MAEDNEYTYLSPQRSQIDDAESQNLTLLNPLDDGTYSVYTESTAVFRDLDSIEDTKLGIYSIVVVLAAAVGGLLFGFDTAVISSCLLFIKDDLGHFLSSVEKESITSITSFTALIGSIVAGVAADKYGRKYVLAVCCLIFIISGIEMGLSNKFWELLIGRGLAGLAVGGASMVVPVFISEVAPTKIRGTLLSLYSISTTGGQLVAYILAYGLQNVRYNWRIAFMVSGIFPFLFLLFINLIPESPRFDIIMNRLREAEISLTKIYPHADMAQVHDKISLIQHDIQSSSHLYNINFWTVIKSKKSTQNALTIGCILMVIQQIVGINAFLYYSATIFSELGFKDPIFASISIALTNFVFSLVPLFYVDKIGRRRLLLRTSWILGVSLFSASFLYHIGSHNGGSSIVNILTLVSIVTYVAGYASGLGSIPWSSVEMIPLEARAIGSTLITCCNWSSNTIISFSYLTLVDKFSAGATFAIFGIISIVSWVWIYKRYPDVSGIPLEEIAKVFEHGVDLKMADELRKKHNRVTIK